MQAACLQSAFAAEAAARGRRFAAAARGATAVAQSSQSAALASSAAALEQASARDAMLETLGALHKRGSVSGGGEPPSSKARLERDGPAELRLSC